MWAIVSSPQCVMDQEREYVACLPCPYLTVATSVITIKPSVTSPTAVLPSIFTKRQGILADLTKTLSCKILVWSFNIALKFDRCLGSSASEGPAQILERYNSFNTKHRCFEISQVLVVRCLTVKGIESQNSCIAAEMLVYDGLDKISYICSYVQTT